MTEVDEQTTEDTPQADEPVGAPVAQPTPKRVLIIMTDGDKADVVQRTMGLWESRAILEQVLRGICAQIDQTARPAPKLAPPPAPAEPETPADKPE